MRAYTTISWRCNGIADRVDAPEERWTCPGCGCHCRVGHFPSLLPILESTNPTEVFVGKSEDELVAKESGKSNQSVLCISPRLDAGANSH
jgi:hypothetical protein